MQPGVVGRTSSRRPGSLSTVTRRGKMRRVLCFSCTEVEQLSSARSPESILCEIERARRELYRVAQRTDSWGEVLRISRELDSLIAEFMASVAATKTEEDEDGLF